MRKVKDERSRKENLERAAARAKAAADRKKAKLDVAAGSESSGAAAASAPEQVNGGLEAPAEGAPGGASPEVGFVDAKEELDPTTPGA